MARHETIDAITGVVTVEERPDDPAMPDSPAPVPQEIANWQFALEAQSLGLMTQAEAEGFVAAGEIPAFMAEFIASLPTGQQGAARIVIRGAKTYRRDHALVLALGEAMRGDRSLDDFLDDFFRAAGAR